MLTVGSLFAGIGGFDLGLERAGMRVIWQSEIDPYACAVLRKHWPTVPNLGDIRGIGAHRLYPGRVVADADIGYVAQDCGLSAGRKVIGYERPAVLCGGFPCQDISNAGKRAGIDGERSGLWSEYARVIGELRPRYVIVENVSALLGRGLERVLGDLAALGFDAEWHCIPASSVGAPHRRDRVWIIAHARSEQHEGNRATNERAPTTGLHEILADAQRDRWQGIGDRIDAGGAPDDDARSETSGANYARDVSDADNATPARLGEHSRQVHALATAIRLDGCGGREWWAVEPDMGRVANGVPRRVDRLRCLGNAIVPQIAEIIGRAIVASETQTVTQNELVETPTHPGTTVAGRK